MVKRHLHRCRCSFAGTRLFEAQQVPRERWLLVHMMITSINRVKHLDCMISTETCMSLTKTIATDLMTALMAFSLKYRVLHYWFFDHDFFFSGPSATATGRFGAAVLFSLAPTSDVKAQETREPTSAITVPHTVLQTLMLTPP